MESGGLVPGGATVGAGALDALGVGDRVELLVSLCPHDPTPKTNNDGPSVEDKKLLSTLPWGSTWIASACPGKSCKQSKPRLVTKESKVMMMRIFYPSKAPTWRDEHRVRVGKSSLWIFKPIQWVDDVSNMWLGGERRVRLTEEEMLLLEQLPWFLPLIEQKRIRRKYRDNKTGVEPENAKHTNTEHYNYLVRTMDKSNKEDNK